MENAPFHSLPGDGAAPARAYWLRASDGVRLRAAHWPAEHARGTVLLFSGRTEYQEKYAGVGADLVRAGYHVLGVDWRGQGLSDRLISDPRPGFILHFNDYQLDVDALCDAAKTLNLPRPWFVLAHSMGGAIALRALTNGLAVERAVYSAPMWGISTGAIPLYAARKIARMMVRTGMRTRTIAGSGGRGTWVLDHGFRNNLLTGNPMVWGRLIAEAHAWPELTLGGASWGWLSAALDECSALETTASPPIPSLVILGTDEAIVSVEAIRKRAAHSADLRLIELPASHHEPLFETDAIRDAAMTALLGHLSGGDIISQDKAT